ncbi:MAG: ATP synthase F1 subunit gamma [Planctomycetota bacterium]|nr:ATP synthase F1 subunit gamma [Planctomycetota bacterium]
MANTRELVKRRKSVRNTRKITKTMEMVATAKLAKAQQAALAARPYAQKLQQVIGDLAAATTDIEHPLLKEHAQPKRAVVIVLTSDRGLCGAFNANIVREGRNLRNELSARGLESEFVVQGRKGVAAYRFLNIPVAKSYLLVSDKPSYQRAEEIGAALIDRYGREEIDEAYIAYSWFKSTSSQAPRVDKILPLSSMKADGGGEALGAGYLFHPNPKTILTDVLPLVVKMSIFTAMLDNTAGEHAARRLAMKNATDAADDMIKGLTRQYNRARQGKITQEIAEIVGGAAALA